MIYEFKCWNCGQTEEVQGRAFHPPKACTCACGKLMQRVYGCQIDTSGCKDPDDVAPEHRTPVTQERNLSASQARCIEMQHGRQIAQTRRDIADGGNRGLQRMTHQVPAALHAAKIKETGDRNYWDDPKNLNRHKSCKVD